MSTLKTPEFFNHLRAESLAAAYLLTGEEGYFIDRALARIMEKGLAGAPRDFNLDMFYGKDTKADAVVAQSCTLPVMAEKRVVVLKEADKLKDMEPIKAYMEAPSPTTVLVLVAENADRAKERALTQAVTGNGVAVHFYHPFESEIPRLINTIAKEAGYDMDTAATACLKEVLGGNIALIESELNKVFQFAGERKKITLEDINESVGDFGLPLVFDLIDAIADKKRGKALEILARLLRDGEQPLMLLGMMASHWRRLLAAREQYSGGDGQEKIGKDFKLNFSNKKAFLGQVSSLDEDELERAFHLFHKADKALKSSSVAPRLVFESLLLELTAGGRA